LLVDAVIRRGACAQYALNVKVHGPQIGHVVALNLVLSKIGYQGV
jgi:ABC-type uncharacterized transport system substrate-binding protein